MKHFALSLIYLILCLETAYAQDFINGDLDGVVGTSVAPTSWQLVPYTDPHCSATNTMTSTADICDPSGPNPTAGIVGTPFSGNTFVSGLQGSLLGSTFYHEGIMQTVSGFNAGCEYGLTFYQALVKQTNFPDSMGGWAVYINNTLTYTSSPSINLNPAADINLSWDKKEHTFIAPSSIITFKFMPMDDESDHSYGDGIRMGIDSIYITSTAGTQEATTSFDTICDGETYLLNSPIPNSADTSILTSGIYVFSYTDSCGKEYLYNYDIYFEDCDTPDNSGNNNSGVVSQDHEIYIPNAFSPNGDGINDILYARTYGQWSELNLIIYDRWGRLIFETTDSNTGWDGTFKNKTENPAVYMFYLYARTNTGIEYIKKGNITLVK